MRKVSMSVVLVVAAIFAAMAGCGKKVDVVRQDTGKGVIYVQTTVDGLVVEYHDEKAAGRLDRLVVFEPSSKAPSQTFWLYSNEEYTETENAAAIRDGRFTQIYVWDESPYGRELQSRYDDVRGGYRKSHPEAGRHPENKATGLPAHNVEKEVTFHVLMAECAIRHHDVEVASAEESQQRATVVSEACLQEVAGFWKALSVAEKKQVIWNDRTFGLFQKIGISLDTRNPVRSVTEAFSVPQETDYRSTWSIYKKGESEESEADQIVAHYRAELVRRGLITQ